MGTEKGAAATNNTTLVIGRIAAGYDLPRGAEHCKDAARASRSGYDKVIADARFDFFRYLEFGEYLLGLRNLVAVGGDLVLVRPVTGVSDEFFCYRTDDFFEKELGEVAAADFESAYFERNRGCLIVTFRRRLEPEEAARRFAGLPPRSLTRLFSFGEGVAMPSYMWIASTTRCNLRCPHCCLPYSHDPGDDMPVETMDKVFAAVGGSLEAANLTGVGEPLFGSNWEYLYKRIRSIPGCRLEMVTNSLLLKEDLVRGMMLSPNPTCMVFSVDGPTRETYERVRGKGNWDKLVRNMEMIRRLREELKPGPGFQLGACFVSMKSNVRYLPELIRLCAEWRVDQMYVSEIGDTVLNRKFFEKETLRQEPELANEYYAKAAEEAARHPFSVFKSCCGYSDDYIRQLRSPSVSQSCPAPTDRKTSWRMPLLGRAKRGLRRLAEASPPAKRAMYRVFRVLELYLSNPIGMPRKTRHWMQQQLGVSRYETLGALRRIRDYCESIHERAFVNVDGEVKACCGLASPLFGNVNQAEFQAIWNSDQYRDFRIMSLLGYPDWHCLHCTCLEGIPTRHRKGFVADYVMDGRRVRLARFLRNTRMRLAPGAIAAPLTNRDRPSVRPPARATCEADS